MAAARQRSHSDQARSSQHFDGEPRLALELLGVDVRIRSDLQAQMADVRVDLATPVAGCGRSGADLGERLFGALEVARLPQRLGQVGHQLRPLGCSLLDERRGT